MVGPDYVIAGKVKIVIIRKVRTRLLNKAATKESQAIVVASVDCLLFWKSENKDLKQISKSTTNVVLGLKFLWSSKFVFP